MIRINFGDADKWITVHPNGRDSTGAPVLVGSGGEIKGGMGGKFTGQKISEINKPQKTDTESSSITNSSTRRLDHGELSIPNRTKNINRDLDRYKAEQTKQQRRDLDDRKFLHEESQRQKAKTLNQGMSEADKKSFHKELTQRLTKKIIAAEGLSKGTAREQARVEVDRLFKNKPEAILAAWKKQQEASTKTGDIDTVQHTMRYFFTTRLGETRYLQADGSLLCKDVPIARTGTQVYLPEEIDLEPDGTGTVTVWRTEDEVFSPETMASFEGVAVTLGHPEDSLGNIVFVNPSNFAELAHGHIQNVRRGTGDKSDLLIADVLIKRQEAIDAVNSGLTDVSCGYDAQYKQLAPGKGKQYQITGNHLAVGIDRGRAGGRCAIGDSIPSTTKEKPVMSWLKKLAQAIKTKDEDALAKLIDEAPDMPSDGMPSIPGSSITINIPSQATALPEGNRTTTDEGEPNKDKTGTGDEEEIPVWAKALLVRLEKLEGKTTDGDPNPDNMTTDEDEEENRKVTGDAAFKRNLIADAEIICPGFQPTSDKGLKRQVLSHVMRTGDSLKAFGVSDFAKAPKATVDAVFTAALALSKAKNHLAPLNNGTRTTDNAASTKHLSPAELNKLNAEFWAKNK